MKILFLLISFYSIAAFTQEKRTEPSSGLSSSSSSSLVTPAVPEGASVVAIEKPSLSVDTKDENMQFFGDFRYRHQTETASPKETRMIQRIQARFGLTNQLHENLKVTLRLMTGSAANSGNQTLGDEKSPGMVRRSFGLDQAYFEYRPLSAMSIYGGKMPQVFTFVGKNQMMLDRDITLEGMALKYVIGLDDGWDLFLQGGSFWIRENYDSLYGQDLTDNMLNAGQMGLSWKSKDWAITFGTGAFSYIDLKNTLPANVPIGTTNASGNGNTLDVNGNYTSNYDVSEYFLEVKRKLGSVDLMVFYEHLQNGNISEYNKAAAYGILAAYGSWSFGWTQQEVQKDAVVGAFTDSDFAGGVTSSRGAMYTLAYKVTKKVQMQYTVYKTESSIDLIPASYDRSNFDLLMTF